MVTLILTGHGRIASGMQAAITQVFGVQPALFALDFPDGMGTAELEQALTQTLALCAGEVVFLTDLLGGSPFRLAATLAQTRPGIEVLAGMNLTLFAEMLFERDEVTSAAEFCSRAMVAGRKGITSLSERLARQQKPTEVTGGL